MLALEDSKRELPRDPRAAASHGDEEAQEKNEKLEDSTPSRASSVSAHPDAEALGPRISRTASRLYTPTHADIERALSHASRTEASVVLAPTKTSDGTILVSWYTTDDPANPQNWHYFKKSFALLLLCLYSFAAYGASSMYVTGEEGVMKAFHVGATPAALGLAIYVVG